MKTRTLLFAVLLSASPALVLGQTPPPEPPDVPTAPATLATPKAPRAARVATVPEAPMAPETEVPPQPPTPEAPKPARAAQAPAPPAPPRPMGQMINVRIDVTLSDSKGASKVLTMTVADGESGMNRTTSAITSGSNVGDFSFNADAAPTVVGNKIRLRLTADATVPIDAGNPTPNRANKLGLRQSQTVILNDGDSVEIARAADPISERTFALSVKVTIQR